MPASDTDTSDLISARLRRPTVHDVARKSEVSIATVSRAFNAPHRVREDVRRRVLEAAEELGYSANPAAKALRSQRTRVIGTIVPTLDNTVFARMANAVQTASSSAGYLGFLQTTQFDNSDLFHHVKLMVDRGAEGLLITGRLDDEQVLDFITEKNIPTITMYSYLEDSPIPSIGFDNYKATARLLQYVLSLGHSRVAMISGTSRWNDRQATRLLAFRDTMTAAGHVPRVYELDRPYSNADGGQMIARILDEAADTTAVLCTSDVLALGVLSECRRRGISVPDDLSVTGFDDFDQAPLLDPPLTTISTPIGEIGTRAVQALIAGLEHGRKMLPLRLETSLIVRGSTSPPANGKRLRAGS
ncbi:substrate-binding domain-containing protein [Bosea sp. 117]|uniref:LacI family DNA-binding transcriptional regulator n=1 Tax=Bosea sp. 117 TaxID=1125973 RepID=UPI0006901DBB|nr:substrate-binding domain-containing protein [Bosea sp. 117]